MKMANVFNSQTARFKLRSEFAAVIKSVPGVDQAQEIFSYSQVTQLLSQYILARRYELFDPRNIMVALVADDPLGKAFAVKAFHRCQVTELLRRQLILVTEASNDSGVSSATENDSELESETEVICGT